MCKTFLVQNSSLSLAVSPHIVPLANEGFRRATFLLLIYATSTDTQCRCKSNGLPGIAFKDSPNLKKTRIPLVRHHEQISQDSAHTASDFALLKHHYVGAYAAVVS